ncbi:ribosomal maturation YjgA family protein [Pedobacter sp. PWIIR3]
MANTNKNTKTRLVYLLLIFIVIFGGLMSRRIPAIPPGFGDLLWAVMIFLMIRCLIIRARISTVAISSLLICYVVEFSQLYHASWIDHVRATTLGALVLGRGFLWSDILAYTIGVLTCVVIIGFSSFRSKLT